MWCVFSLIFLLSAILIGVKCDYKQMKNVRFPDPSIHTNLPKRASVIVCMRSYFMKLEYSDTAKTLAISLTRRYEEDGNPYSRLTIDVIYNEGRRLKQILEQPNAFLPDKKPINITMKEFSENVFIGEETNMALFRINAFCP